MNYKALYISRAVTWKTSIKLCKRIWLLESCAVGHIAYMWSKGKLNDGNLTLLEFCN